MECQDIPWSKVRIRPNRQLGSVYHKQRTATEGNVGPRFVFTQHMSLSHQANTHTNQVVCSRYAAICRTSGLAWWRHIAPKHGVRWNVVTDQSVARNQTYPYESPIRSKDLQSQHQVHHTSASHVMPQSFGLQLPIRSLVSIGNLRTRQATHKRACCSGLGCDEAA